MPAARIMLVPCLMLFALVSSAQKQIEIMQPKKEFDIQLASKMLNEGTSEIKGYAYYEERTPIGIKVGETIYGRVGVVVSLYPLTPYIEEYLSLKKRNKEGKRIATISSLANCYRIESKIYSQKGEFLFVGLAAGKYYLESLVHFPSGIGGREVSAIVEIKNNGDKAECKLKYIY
ncbi:hypothetical protein LZZ85_05795 [Terrimonas sp. NA20]|uniref:Carboxypeptidase regulatory-like domain-containing protein n=1 Tax=Terrimonas ginsenosidimutans TaxID=2908004 RepID=A0ABS9KN91_9BACT|nr:hypothetical protein [Terrimonas ginsenosidimutans]MCG2613781.1 hypothetical protein [Terrimonas ginsenosidimutans]